MKIIIHTDGGSRGNPGDAAIGVILADEEGRIIKEISEYLGRTTNNIAEYKALIRGLEEARKLGANEVEAFADSELMIKQLWGVYAVKNEGLKSLFQQVQKLRLNFKKITFSHVPRAQNKAADRLVNQALDRQLHQENAVPSPRQIKGVDQAIVEVAVLPVGTQDTSLSAYVAACQKILQEAKEINYQLTAMGTIIEGPLDTVLNLARRLHEVPFQTGVSRVVTTIKIDDRRDKLATIEGKIASVETKL